MNYDGKNGNGYQPRHADKGEPPKATKLTREAERASVTGDFYKLAEMHNKQALELIETILAKHTATMLEALHALASRPVEAAQGGVTDGWTRALDAAVAAIYFADSSDYETALWQVVKYLKPDLVDLLQSDESGAYEQVKAMLAATPEVDRG
jgi:hypothetical protein